jgi:hypothetical protein
VAPPFRKLDETEIEEEYAQLGGWEAENHKGAKACAAAPFRISAMVFSIYAAQRMDLMLRLAPTMALSRLPSTGAAGRNGSFVHPYYGFPVLRR